jgi:acyl-CoA thioesterase I
MKKHLVIVFLLLTGFSVCAQNNSNNSILVVGDSLSAAYGLEVEQGWVALLQARLQQHGSSVRVTNISISGETTSGALTRLPEALRQYGSGIVVIELGGNDGLRGISLTQMQGNLERMVQMSLEQGARVLILGVRLPPNYGPVFNERFQQVFKDVAVETGVEYLPAFMRGIADKRELMQSDGIHPTKEAQLMLLDNVWPRIRSMLGSRGD